MQHASVQGIGDIPNDGQVQVHDPEHHAFAKLALKFEWTHARKDCVCDAIVFGVSESPQEGDHQLLQRQPAGGLQTHYARLARSLQAAVNHLSPMTRSLEIAWPPAPFWQKLGCRMLIEEAFHSHSMTSYGSCGTAN